ncbi:MAG: DUF503 domain-containing protein [Tindallia sp. MSAO_Bac2]|nr:MAG: DUF503 domain-containing protein [Tindallia sp. MSAO_Bac2]
MKVGICSFKMIMYEGGSLKEKRMIVRSLIQRIRSRYNVSISEVADHEKWKLATIGFCCISNEKQHVERTMQEVIRFAEADGRMELMDIETEIV